MGSMLHQPASFRLRVVAVWGVLLLAICNAVDWHLVQRAARPSDVYFANFLGVAQSTKMSPRRSTEPPAQPPANARAIPADAIASLNHRWNSIWRADAAAAEANVATLDVAADLVERAKRGDLDATADLVGAATWCLAGGPLVNVADFVGNRRQPCYERFGDTLASREALERAVFGWVLQLAAAGLDDAALYASAMLRGNGNRVLAENEGDGAIQEQQKAQLLGQLQTLAERGSADAASELHGHWSGASEFRLRDDGLASYYAALTQRLDPERDLLAVAQ
jgi:hypothetical protein